MQEAEARIDELLERVEEGEAFLLTRDGKPIVILRPPGFSSDDPE